MSNNQDNLKDEYSADLIKSGKRGKFAHKYNQGTNVVFIEPELHKLFPDTESVNEALRQYASEHDLVSR
ncbi:hypothetical protein [Glaciecola sp. 1036]|uniref:hypothetical protein n=1 Tax=Alteromonadaceae TaxID=72275 RepID=UPI003CFECF54